MRAYTRHESISVATKDRRLFRYYLAPFGHVHGTVAQMSPERASVNQVVSRLWYALLQIWRGRYGKAKRFEVRRARMIAMRSWKG